MRKRKSPIALVTVLAVVVCGIVGYSFATSSHPGGNPSDAPPPQEVPDAKPIGTPRAPESASKVGSDVKNLMSAQRPQPSRGDDGPVGPPGSGPLILNPHPMSMKPEKPKPNSTSTSAQWYNPESSMSGKG